MILSTQKCFLQCLLLHITNTVKRLICAHTLWTTCSKTKKWKQYLTLLQNILYKSFEYLRFTIERPLQKMLNFWCNYCDTYFQIIHSTRWHSRRTDSAERDLLLSSHMCRPAANIRVLQLQNKRKWHNVISARKKKQVMQETSKQQKQTPAAHLVVWMQDPWQQTAHFLLLTSIFCWQLHNNMPGETTYTMSYCKIPFSWRKKSEIHKHKHDVLSLWLKNVTNSIRKTYSKFNINIWWAFLKDSLQRSFKNNDADMQNLRHSNLC